MSKRVTRNNNPHDPFTPDPSRERAPAPPTVVPDTRAEAVLFKMYIEQKELAAEWQAKFERLQTKMRRMDDRFTKFRTRNQLRKLASEITHIPLTKKREETK